MPHPLVCARRSAAGFSLLEVLISLVVLSVGLLSVAALMSTTLKSNDSAYMRTQAEVEAYNILDRMRANNAAVAAGHYIYTMPGAPSDANRPSTTCTGATAGCSSADLADYDLSQWQHDLAKRLPAGRGSIVTSPIANGTGIKVTVTVLWNDSRASHALNGAAAPSNFSLSVHSVL
ncbi:MAG: type IV pilus modification protein PilV [Gammaproteobacteria bacterium]